MKKVLFIASLCVSFAAAAQHPTDKGWRSVGGTGRLYIDLDGSNGTSNTFLLRPETYWFVGNSFSIGADFAFGAGFSKFKFGDSTVTSQFISGGVAPGFRFFFREPEKKWRPYVFGNAGYGFGTYRTKRTGVPDVVSKSNGFIGYTGGGMAWFFSDHAAFDIRMTVIDYSGGELYYNPDFTIGIQAFFD